MRFQDSIDESMPARDERCGCLEAILSNGINIAPGKSKLPVAFDSCDREFVRFLGRIVAQR